jgi:hypothetical protein
MWVLLDGSQARNEINKEMMFPNSQGAPAKCA